MKYKVPFIRPHFPSAEIMAEEYSQIVSSNWFTNFGPKESELTAALADYIGEGVFVSTTANATLALDLAIRALFDKKLPAKQVIVPSFTFAAGPEVLISNGFTPVFIDINPESLQPSLVDASEYIGNNHQSVAGILLCNSFGVGNTEVDGWEDLAKKYNLPMIIDSAAGLGSRYSVNEKIGSRGDCEIFSMHATKPFCVGEGGLVVSKNQELIDNIKSLQNFGYSADKEIQYIGTNAKLQEINCAIGLRQLDNYETRLINRQNSLHNYKKHLVNKGYKFQSNDDISSVPFVTVICTSAEDTDSRLKRLVDSLVEARKYYKPVHTSRVIMQQSEVASTLSVTEDIYSRVLSLPMHDDMTDDDVIYITQEL